MKNQRPVSGRFIVFEPAGEQPKDGWRVGQYYNVRFVQDVGDPNMEDMMKQVLGGWFRTAIATGAGAVGMAEYVQGDVLTSLVAFLVAVAMGAWSQLQKKGKVPA